MSGGAPGGAVGRLRALGWFLISACYSVLAYQLGGRAVALLGPGLPAALADIVRLLAVLVLLLLGYAAMGSMVQRQRAPLAALGLARRPGALREWALGAALGWGGILACVLPAAIFGELVLQFSLAPPALLGLLTTAAFLALAALAEELAFRGYPFQRLIDATGPSTATVLLSALFASAHLANPGSTAASWCSTFLAGWLFSLAYLRTRGLWLGWGMHFAWNAATALLFGLPLSGLTDYSPVITTYTRGPVWLTGGGYGPEGSALVIPVLLGMLIVLARVTVDLKHRWATPVIIPGGYPVDIDALSRAEHARGMGADVAGTSPAQGLVQIATPAPSLAPPPRASEENEPR